MYEYDITDDHILIQDHAVPEKVCEEWVEATKNLGGDQDYYSFLKSFKIDFYNMIGSQTEMGEDRSIRDRVMRSDDMDFPLSITLGSHFAPLISSCTGLLQLALGQYVKRFPYLSNYGVFTIPWMKYHIVRPEGGYHGLHAEWSTDRPDISRILVWHLSLTSHENQGELEFLYQRKRITPSAGRLVVWPAYFTHVHRGNILREGEKHYITGWFYVDPESASGTPRQS